MIGCEKYRYTIYCEKGPKEPAPTLARCPMQRWGPRPAWKEWPAARVRGQITDKESTEKNSDSRLSGTLVPHGDEVAYRALRILLWQELHSVQINGTMANCARHLNQLL